MDQIKPPEKFLKLLPHKYGDTWEGLLLRLPVLPSGLTLAGAVARMDFRAQPDRNSALGQTLSSDSTPPGLLIDDVERTVEARRGKFDDTMIPQLWYWELQLSWPAILDYRGEPITKSWFRGTLLVYPDTTE